MVEGDYENILTTKISRSTVLVAVWGEGEYCGEILSLPVRVCVHVDVWEEGGDECFQSHLSDG